MRRLLPVLVLASCLLTAPAAFADSGSITLTDNDAATEAAIVTVSVTVTNDVCDTPACDWVAGVGIAAAGQPCTGARVVRASQQSGAGTRTIPFPDPIAVTKAEPRLCLIMGPETGPAKILGQLDVPFLQPPPPPPPEPPPPPPPTPEPRPALTVAAVRKHVKPILTQIFKRRFKQRRGFHRSCTRTRRAEVRCFVRWRHGRLRFKGPLWLRASPGSPHGITFDEQIRKTRVRG